MNHRNDPKSTKRAWPRRLSSRLLLATMIGLLLISLVAKASAHNRSISYACWTLEGAKATVVLTLSRRDWTAIADSEQLTTFQQYLPSAVGMFDTTGRCRIDETSFERRRAAAGQLRFAWQVRCTEASGARQVRSDLLFDQLPAHIQFVTVRTEPPEPPAEYLLTAAKRQVVMASAGPAQGSVWQSVKRYTGLGVEHILTGFDHIVFLLALVFVARSAKQVALAITGFTVGHSITLSLTVLGYTQPNVRAVEALIGLSILVVAAENTWLISHRQNRAIPRVTTATIAATALLALCLGSELGRSLLGVAVFTACSFALSARMSRPEILRWSLAVLFGLVHGFGFASALGQLGPWTDRLALSLFSFNAGVELGQLGIVLLVWPALVWLRRRQLHVQTVQWGSAVAAALGVFWFVSRALA